MHTDKVRFGTREIKYSIITKSRSTLQINVEPEGDIVVMAPSSASPEIIQNIVKKRALWIIKQQAHFKTYYQKPIKKEYVSGETHRYLGKQYRLKVVQREKEQVVQKGKYIYLFVRSKSKAGILLEDWFHVKAKKMFKSKLEILLRKMSNEKIKPKQLKIRSMKTRWGSCTPGGNIILHPALIKAPTECIEYVIVHELCHLKYFKHDRRFYSLLERYCPNYMKRKDKLNKQEIL